MSRAKLEFAIAAPITISATLLVRDLSNLMLFRFVAKRPNSLSGRVNLSTAILLRISLFQILLLAVPLLAITAVTPTPSLLGALLSLVIFAAIHLVRISKSLATPPEA